MYLLHSYMLLVMLLARQAIGDTGLQLNIALFAQIERDVAQWPVIVNWTQTLIRRDMLHPIRTIKEKIGSAIEEIAVTAPQLVKDAVVAVGDQPPGGIGDPGSE